MAAPGITRRDVLKTVAGGAALLAARPSTWAAQTATPPQIRIGVIGIGNRSHAHLRILKNLADRYQLTATCDIIPERAKAGAKLAGGGDIKTFTNHRDLLRSGLCQAAIITTPNYTHREIAVDALDAGLHVLCEKPMTTTLADGKAIVDAVCRSKRVFAVGQQFRYATVYRKVRELLKAGTIGELKYVWAEEFRGDWARLYKDPQENAKKNWRFFQKLSGGTLVEKNCHDFDILTWLIGAKPVRVSATGGNSVYKDRETIDHAGVAVDYQGGAQLTLGLCLFAKAPRDGTVIVGTEGNIEFPRGGNRITMYPAGKKTKEQVIELPDQAGDMYGHRGTRELHEDFIDAIATGRTPLADVHVGYNALRIPIAAEEAIRLHKVIELSQLDG